MSAAADAERAGRAGASVALPAVLPLSATDPATLEEATDDLAGYLERHPDSHLASLAARLQAASAGHGIRRVIVASSAAEAAHDLRGRDPRRVFTGAATTGRPVVFMFSGVGDQYPGLAAGLYRHVPAFRRELDRCFRVLEPEVGVDLHEVLYPSATPGQRHGRPARPDLAAMFERRRSTGEIHCTAIAQPLVFAVQYAMGVTMRWLGASPSVLLGYSIGEYVAACMAGVMPRENMLRLVALRARLVAALPEGAMLAVMSPAERVEPYLGGRLSVAALDGPRLTVLAGPAEDIERARDQLIGDSVACQPLATSHAFHSAMMDPVVVPLQRMLATFPLRPPAVPVLSNVTGTWLGAEEAASAGYWACHLRNTVRFADDLAEVWRLRSPVLVELGPGRTLTQLALQNLRSPAGPGISQAGEPALILQTLPGPLESRPDTATFLSAVGQLWVSGMEIDFSALHDDPGA